MVSNGYTVIYGMQCTVSDIMKLLSVYYVDKYTELSILDNDYESLSTMDQEKYDDTTGEIYDMMLTEKSIIVKLPHDIAHDKDLYVAGTLLTRIDEYDGGPLTFEVNDDSEVLKQLMNPGTFKHYIVPTKCKCCR